MLTDTCTLRQTHAHRHLHGHMLTATPIDMLTYTPTDMLTDTH